MSTVHHKVFKIEFIYCLGSSNTESELMPVPNGLFYTQESDQPNHSGYLRIIPLEYENDQGKCDDYANLVRVFVYLIEFKNRKWNQIRNTEKNVILLISELKMKSGNFVL